MFVSFKYKIMIAVLIIELFFLSIIIIYNYYNVQKFTYNLVDNQIKSSVILFKELVKTPLMVYDLATLDNMTERFGNLPNIDYVILKDDKGRILSKFTKSDNIKKFDIKSSNTNYKYIEFTIKDERTILGKGSVVFNKKKANTKINEHTKNIIKIAILEIFLSILVSFFIGRLLTKNLIILDKAFKNVSSYNKRIVRVDIDSDDEFDHLATSFHNMQLKIKDEIVKNEQKEKQMFQQSRSAAMGEMMSAIIHQWKQPLNALSMLNSGMKLSLLVADNLTREELSKNIEQIEKQINHMNTTMDDFRDFFKPQKLTQFNINENIKSVKNLIGKIYASKNISIKTDLQNNLNTQGYQNELNQVIINILNNARDIIVETNCEIKDIFVKTFQEKDKVVITITDCAGGVPEDIIDKIFDPYITTKSESKGTGIGLDMSKTIIKKVNGNLTIRNVITTINETQFKGAQFKIELDLV